ncbi:MAG: phenylalanine--tRNA ligase subunit beta, partial [Alphaproteobacteria bacterium]|nr:phenylalanine--tRNA ligase subunit beta [Alphaproteobacteria bacterium]
LARRLLANRGMVEAVTWSFIPEKYAQFFGCNKGLKLANPVSNEMSHMRPSLLPGLLMAAARNADRGFTDLALFEAGQEFTAPAPDGQRQLVAGLRCGNRTPRHWARQVEAVDIFDAKADAEALLATYGLELTHLSLKRDVPNWYHPGRAGRLCQNPRTNLANFGEVHPAILEAFNLTMPVVAFELYLDNLPVPKRANKSTPPPFIVSNRQSLRRDFAFEVAQDVPASMLIHAAYEADKKFISHVSLFDAFTSEQMGEGVKSLAIEVTLQPQDANLTDAQIEEISAQIIAKVEKATGGKLRQ